MPPSVLPAVATSTALQKMSGLSFNSPNRAGSEPMGSSVADTKAATNRVDRPNSGSANRASSDCNQACMAGHVKPSRTPRVARRCPISSREIARAYNRASFFGTPPPRPRMNIGSYTLANNVFVAPMAGVTDRPFRQLCRSFGAGYAVSEMVTSRKDLWNSLKTSRRANHEGEPGPVAVQIAGTEAQMMAEAAAYNVDRGAQIIDINMGCPAKKVCNKWAGSALMQDEPLAIAIAEAVVAACEPHGVPVTLKMRTGWD